MIFVYGENSVCSETDNLFLVVPEHVCQMMCKNSCWKNPWVLNCGGADDARKSRAPTPRRRLCSYEDSSSKTRSFTKLQSYNTNIGVVLLHKKIDNT